MRLTIHKTYTLFLLILLIVSACQKDVGTIQELDANNIAAYIKKNNLTVTQYNNTGIYYNIIQPGTGPDVANNKELALVYTVHSIDGKYSAVDTLFLNRYANFAGYIVPEGLKTGVLEILKKTNGQIRLLIPSALAYGRNGNGKVDGNVSLDITVRVIDKASLPQYDDAVIKQFIQANNLTGFTKSATGIYYKITSPGTGTDVITDESQLKLTYSGKLLDGRLFDSNTDAVFYLQDLIAAWRQTVPLLKAGGSMRMLVPAAQAYGFKGSGNIPPFACLDFEITVSTVSN